jgi:zinc and cadmium transporter
MLLGKGVEGLIPVAAAFTAGAFIYIAGSDLVPELHKTQGFGRTLAQIITVIVGFGFMFLLAVGE